MLDYMLCRHVLNVAIKFSHMKQKEQIYSRKVSSYLLFQVVTSAAKCDPRKYSTDGKMGTIWLLDSRWVQQYLANKKFKFFKKIEQFQKLKKLKRIQSFGFSICFFYYI